ncbi:phage repressor protein C with HTH and peptisase S24 domain [Sphingobium sp. JAI105]|nr:phage repressor protein C with HTH and peptisase S24 domain [Sphingobium sp. JAI105]
MEEIGSTQEDLAAAVGATQGAISQILTGATRNSRLLPKIAENLAVNLRWLAGLTDEKIDMFDDTGTEITEDDLAAIRAGTGRKKLSKPHQLLEHKPTAVSDHSDTVELAEFNVAYGLGGAYIHDMSVKSRMRTFSRAWIRQFSDSPFDNLFWATGNGISMMPAILEHDILLIDTMQNTPRMWDQFWAIDMHGMGMIKALRPTKEGGMRILSINPDWPEEVAYDGEMNIVGRVVAIVRKV